MKSFEPTDEQRERHAAWLAEYAQAISGAGEGFLYERLVEDMSVPSRPEWMHPLDAMAVVTSLMEGVFIEDPVRRLEAKDAMRTISCLSRRERTHLVAEVLGMTYEHAKRYDPEWESRRRNLAGRTAVYRHFDDRGVLLYVGISNDPDSRFRSHQHMSPWTPYAARMDVVWYETRPEALDAERDAIRDELPVFNLQGSQAEPDAVEDYLLMRDLFGSLDIPSATP